MMMSNNRNNVNIGRIGKKKQWEGIPGIRAQGNGILVPDAHISCNQVRVTQQCPRSIPKKNMSLATLTMFKPKNEHPFKDSNTITFESQTRSSAHMDLSTEVAGQSLCRDPTRSGHGVNMRSVEAWFRKVNRLTNNE